jgi:D-alanyl-D-alanine endopeptidase (penicillin-binding protein 7)
MRRHLITILLTLFTGVCSAGQTNSYLYNHTDDKIMLGNDLTEVRPIASITKVMTAMVMLDQYKDLSEIIKTGTGLLPKKDYTREQILTAMLVRSDNGAAEVLSRNYPGGRKAFLHDMNQKAKSLGMQNTNFDDPTGLSRKNVSTINDLSLMMIAAHKYPKIKEISIKKQALFETRYKKKIRKIELHNTNSPILFEFDTVVVSKTGFTNPAGWCVAMVVEKFNKTYVVIVLGAKNKSHRIDKVKEVMYNHIVDEKVLDPDTHDIFQIIQPII